MNLPSRSLCLDGMPLAAVVLNEEDWGRGRARLAQQSRDRGHNTFLQFGRHEAHQTNLYIDNHQRGFQSAPPTHNGEENQLYCGALPLKEHVMSNELRYC